MSILGGGECQWNFRNSAAELRTFVRGVQRGVPRSVMRSSTSNFTLPGVDFLIGVRTLYRESPRGVFVDSTWSPRCFSGFRCELGAESTHGKVEFQLDSALKSGIPAGFHMESAEGADSATEVRNSSWRMRTPRLHLDSTRK